MKILGLNAYHGDSAAALVVDGQLVAAVAEERFNRLKHWAGLPAQAAHACLEQVGLGWADLDYLAINRNPRAHLIRKLAWALYHQPSARIVKNRAENFKLIKTIPTDLAKTFGSTRVPPTRFIEHHFAHAASAFFVSPFEQAAIMTIDGFGDFVSVLLAKGEGNRITPLRRVFFPHSLGLFYLMVTQYLGFWNYGDEYKVMGLAAYGQPTYLDQFRKIVRVKADGTFELDLAYFLHHTAGVMTTWFNQQPTASQVFSPRFVAEFGPARTASEPLTSHHENIAASLQALTEEVYVHLLRHLAEQTHCPNLCLAGGVALNSSANGKIFERTPFREIFIQPAASDDGGAIGAALAVQHQLLGQPRSCRLSHSYWGPSYDDATIEQALQAAGIIAPRLPLAELVTRTAQDIADGKIVGWFQGRMEFGPRALGNRSIVVDPRRAEMKDILNERIKRREPFRPFAPSILAERTGEYFELDYPEPFMVKTYKIRKEKQSIIPAVTHRDGTGRLQTVTREANERYYALIEAFDRLTGVPIILNTSFNENEPIVNRPEEAINCFLRTRMDTLVLGDRYVTR